jgi:glycosyltransferase involved in cell wall biosynthesis
MSTPPKVLFVCHNHPDLHPGGTEIFSHGLFQAMKVQHGLEAVYLACVNTVHRGRLPGTLLQSAGRAPDEILLWAGHFDRFTLSQIDLHGIVPEFERLLLAFRPDVVHFHHVLLMGVEAFQVVRRVLPEAAILLTLHDYYPICANDGQMVTTRDRKLCRSASADSCASCFPGTQRDQFVMRELFIKQNFSLVDRFISPSIFLKQRYVEWGLPEDKIDIVRNGLRDAEPAAHRSLTPGRRRDRFAFFGHLNPFKGGLVAIEAAKRLAQRTGGAISLTLHGSAEFQTEDFKAELAKACENAPFVVARGRYNRDELPALMADADWVIVPSIWWENAPLIIQEAFQHRRPVICSGIGGMAESVRDGVDGLWFHAGDPRHLADKMAEALDPDRWTRLVAGINKPYPMSASADEHLALYKTACATRRGRTSDVAMSVPERVAQAAAAATQAPSVPRPLEAAPTASASPNPARPPAPAQPAKPDTPIVAAVATSAPRVADVAPTPVVANPARPIVTPVAPLATVMAAVAEHTQRTAQAAPVVASTTNTPHAVSSPPLPTSRPIAVTAPSMPPVLQPKSVATPEASAPRMPVASVKPEAKPATAETTPVTPVKTETKPALAASATPVAVSGSMTTTAAAPLHPAVIPPSPSTPQTTPLAAEKPSAPVATSAPVAAPPRATAASAPIPAPAAVGPFELDDAPALAEAAIAAASAAIIVEKSEPLLDTAPRAGSKILSAEATAAHQQQTVASAIRPHNPAVPETIKPAKPELKSVPIEPARVVTPSNIVNKPAAAPVEAINPSKPEAKAVVVEPLQKAGPASVANTQVAPVETVKIEKPEPKVSPAEPVLKVAATTVTNTPAPTPIETVKPVAPEPKTAPIEPALKIAAANATVPPSTPPEPEVKSPTPEAANTTPQPGPADKARPADGGDFRSGYHLRRMLAGRGS